MDDPQTFDAVASGIMELAGLALLVVMLETAFLLVRNRQNKKAQRIIMLAAMRFFRAYCALAVLVMIFVPVWQVRLLLVGFFSFVTLGLTLEIRASGGRLNRKEGDSGGRQEP